MTTGIIVVMVVTGSFGLLFASLGIYMMLTGRGSFLIAGYNTMPTKEKEKYDSKALCKFIGKYIAFVGLMTVLFAVALTIGITNDSSLLWVTVSYTAIVSGLGVFVAVYCNTGNRFRK